MNEKQFHTSRRAFIIFPETGILISKLHSPMSHTEMLKSLDLSADVIASVINNNPRGYYKDNNLVFYQGSSMLLGDVWELKPENYPTVKEYFQDLKKMLSFKNDVNIFFGVRAGDVGDVWSLINPVKLSFFKKTKVK